MKVAQHTHKYRHTETPVRITTCKLTSTNMHRFEAIFFLVAIFDILQIAKSWRRLSSPHLTIYASVCVKPLLETLPVVGDNYPFIILFRKASISNTGVRSNNLSQGNATALNDP